MEKEIKKRLDEYLEFDSDELFHGSVLNPADLIRVFGGAIRDSIAGLPIHDVDIICGSLSSKTLDSLLIKKGYHYIESLTPKDLSSVYSEIQIINEPRSYVKGSKVVQVIRPRFNTSNMVSQAQKYEEYKNSLDHLVSNVDISCCGVSYDGRRLRESVTNAILHCKNRVFEVNDGALMIVNTRSGIDRLSMRKHKLLDRGWKEIDKKERVVVNRDLRVGDILDDIFYV
jgi:hypothetical protein